MPSLVWAEVSTWRSMTVTFIGLAPYSRGQSGEGFQRIVDQDLAQQMIGQAVGQRVLVVEMPVRVVGGEQQHLVGTDLLDDALQLIGARWRIERLDGQAHVFARVGRGRFLQP